VILTQFVVSHGWFNRFKARDNFRNVKVSGEAVIRHRKSLTSTKLGCSGRKCQIENIFRKRKRQ
jgi:hypothetical protein